MFLINLIISCFYFNLYSRVFGFFLNLTLVKKLSKMLTYFAFFVFFTLHLCPYFQEMDLYSEWFSGDAHATKTAIFQCLSGSFYFSFFLALQDEDSRLIDYFFFILIQFFFYVAFLLPSPFISFLVILLSVLYVIFIFFSKKVGFFVILTSIYCLFVLFSFGSFLV